MIKPALRRGWRNRQTVQYGVAPAHAVVLGPVNTTIGSFLDLLDGTRSLPQLREAATTLGLAPDTADRLARRLAEVGVLDDATADRAAAAAVSDRLRPDLASLSVMHAEPGAGLRRLTERRSAQVQVKGAGRVGAAVATALSAAGVGRVDVQDGGCVELCDTSPGGTQAGQRGERRTAAAQRVVRRASPWPTARDRTERPERGLDLVIVAPRDGLGAYAPDPLTAEPLISSGTPHLYAGVVEGTGVVGPLVLPGVSPCAGCLERSWAQREPTWPLVVGQWRNARRTGVPACDTALATVVAGVTAAQALSFLDGGHLCSVGYRSRYVLPELMGERESVRAHPECPCDAISSPLFTASSPDDAVESPEVPAAKAGRPRSKVASQATMAG